MNLKTRKQEAVRQAIFDAAIELFIKNGFEETTVDQVAEAAGISQRSFFRYFAAKQDLLAYRIAGYGDALVSAVAACPPGMPPLDVVRHAAVAGIEFSQSEPRTLQIIGIASQNIGARQAHRSALISVEDRLAETYAARTKDSSKFNMEPRILALLTLMVGDVARASWFAGESKDSLAGLNQVFFRFSQLFCQGSSPTEERPAQLAQRKRDEEPTAPQLVAR